MRKFLSTARRRLFMHFPRSIGFAFAGAITVQVIDIPEWIEKIGAPGRGIWWFLPVFSRAMLTTLVAGLVVVLTIRLCTDDGRSLLRRPWRFLVLLLAGACAARWLENRRLTLTH